MKLLHIVTWSFEYNSEYTVDIVINKGILEAWLYKNDIGIKEFLIGMGASDTGFDDFVFKVKHMIDEENVIASYEEDYVDM